MLLSLNNRAFFSSVSFIHFLHLHVLQQVLLYNYILPNILKFYLGRFIYLYLKFSKEIK